MCARCGSRAWGASGSGFLRGQGRDEERSGMASRTNKEKILAVIRSMPDEAIDRLYLLWKVERGLEQADAGEVTDHGEFMKVR